MNKYQTYWNNNTPQYWYSNNEYGTMDYYFDLEKTRYNKIYKYLFKEAEFTKYSNKKVLEIGCGHGTDLIQYAKNGAIVTGIDFAQSAIDKTRDFFNAFGFSATLLQANALKIPFPDCNFNLVYSFGVLHHIYNIEKAIDEIYRVLKPNATALIMIYGKGFNYYHKIFIHITTFRFLKKSFQQTINELTEYSGHSPLTKMYSCVQAEKLFSKFNILYIKKVYTPQVPFFPDHLFIKVRK